MKQIIKFWEGILLREEWMFETISTDPDAVALFVHELLLEVHPDLVFEIPFHKDEEKYQLIISADGDIDLFPLVFDLKRNAPTLEYFEIIPFRPRTNEPDQAIELDDLYLEYEDIFYTINNDELPLNITIYIKGYDGQDNRYIHGYFLLLDSLIGEFNAVTCIAETTILPYDDQEASRFIFLRNELDIFLEEDEINEA